MIKYLTLMCLLCSPLFASAEVLIPQRADPWLLKVDDSYYFTASVPEFNRIELRRADSVVGLADAEVVTIWEQREDGEMSANIWAPEIHRIDDAWYIYFAAGRTDAPFAIRTYVLENTSEDPLSGEWQELGQLETAWDTFTLDTTHFRHQGTNYLVWAQQHPEHDYNSALFIAELLSPTRVGPQTKISEPEFDWETQGYAVNEGAAALIRHGRVMLSFSASATDANYAMGLLWADADADLLDADNWHKSAQPVFYTNADLERYGPGHNSFTVDEQGRDLMVYHARSYREIEGNSLHDPNRDSRVRLIQWDDEGFPDFAQQEPDLKLK
ncbi:family 43 glycosylhydrolase [Aliidiomarina soli]|uniref:Alpha-N-arabinofuranosidase n=1 Tax=Aliidiomarina soli TaxID=1928574 RepID=A0A432WFA8_9GAMM|nr:family 43 glycosylhydrolase [Aliidiomarina soli]RUO32444.1 alpha-N-arabinofuranosidase [Aliidiomarina soli]